jgi:hypothetical protein
MVERMLVALLARGHCLLEGVPGRRQEPGRRDARDRWWAARRCACSSPRTWSRATSSAPGSTAPPRRRSTSSSARCSPTWCWPTRSTAPPPRCSRRCSR